MTHDIKHSLALRPVTDRERLLAQVAIALYTKRACLQPRRDHYLVLLDALGLNGRTVRSAKRGQTKTPARVSANPPQQLPGRDKGEDRMTRREHGPAHSGAHEDRRYGWYVKCLCGYEAYAWTPEAARARLRQHVREAVRAES